MASSEVLQTLDVRWNRLRADHPLSGDGRVLAVGQKGGKADPPPEKQMKSTKKVYVPKWAREQMTSGKRSSAMAKLPGCG
jgi:hypothetical protein